MDDNTKVISFDEKKESKKEVAIGVYVHKFRKPFKYEGETYDEMHFDLEGLSGQDIVDIENEMNLEKEFSIAAELSKNLQARIAAKAAGVNSELIKAMPIKDFNKITNEVRDFLLDTGF